MTTDELLRFAFTQSSNQAIVEQATFPGWATRTAGPGIAGPGPGTPWPPPTTAGELPGRADPRGATMLPFGTTDLLDATPYRDRVRGDRTDRDRLGHALIAAFGLQRREPSNSYNDHRGYPSVRSKFPVHAFITRGRRQAWLDVYRHALVDMGAGDGTGPDRILLTARYTHLPPHYGKIRGPLTELELGINLRALSVGLDLFGVPYHVDLPDSAAESRLRALALAPAWGWTLPVSVLPWPAGQPVPVASPAMGLPASQLPDDPVLRAAVTVNRAGAVRPADEPVTGSPAIPPPVAGETFPSWADVLWARSSGFMPRGLNGLSARRVAQPFSVVADAIDWLGVPPPTTLLRQVARLFTVTVCLQDVEGHAAGVYRLADGRLSLVARDDLIGTALEAGYAHRQAYDVGCGVRLANAIWFISARPREIAELGPWAWPLASLASGWAIQGVCLAAAAHGLYARPARAFQEIHVQRPLRLAPDELILISATCGTQRFTESVLDLRL